MEGNKLKIHKIGLDIDKTTDPTNTEKKLKRMDFLVDKYDVYSSASGTGLHFEIYLKKPVSIGRSFDLREAWGDDPKRITFSKADFMRGWDFDILFTYKKINGEWKKRQFIKEVRL